MNKSKIDIILPTYNGAKYIRELLESLLKQSYQEFVVLIRDDLSKDNTKEIIREYEIKYPEKFNIIEDNYGNMGVVNNTFEILKYSSNDYIMFCDQDDVWFINKVKHLLSFIKQIETKRCGIPILIHSDVMVTDKKLKVIDQSFMHYNQLYWKRNKLCNLIQKNIVQGASVIFNKLLLERAHALINNKTKTTDKTVYHDLWFAVIAAAFGEIGFCSKPLMYYRQHDNNLAGAKHYEYKITDIINNEKNFTFRYSNYLTVNRKLCCELLRIYGKELKEEQVKTINHLKEYPSDMKMFFLLKMYHNYSLKEIFMRAILGVVFNS